MTDVAAIRTFWDEQASKGEKAGTQDLILKQLEQRAILRELERFGIDNTDHVLECGCGHGELAHMVADQFGCDVTAIDTSEGMIKEAKRRFSPVYYSVGDVLTWTGVGYDAVITERCLINLPTCEEQHAAIDAIAARLEPGGIFLMCEHSAAGLFHLNQERARLNLPTIQQPWHNRYFWDDGADLGSVRSLRLIESIHFSATYYWLSRVINAKLAADKGEQPDYDAPVNRLALELPYSCVDPKFSQGRLWIWEKP